MFYSKNLKKHINIKHCFFSRKKGFSNGIYQSLNCGRGSKDRKKNISKNLSFVSDKMGVSKNKLVLMHQTHSNKVLEIKENNYKSNIKADAMVTKMKGIVLGVLTADCVPIILYDVNNKIIGCVHAGWRGAYSNIIENTIKKIKKMNSNNLIYASVGPCIGQKNYEVDFDFFKKFTNKSNKNKKYFINKKKNKLFNLRKFVTDKLLKYKVKVDQVNRDTFAQKSNFFSYRRSTKLDEKDYGRCISTVCMPLLY
jgi:YfiH family protein